jgi:hypothetical protein
MVARVATRGESAVSVVAAAATAAEVVTEVAIVVATVVVVTAKARAAAREVVAIVVTGVQEEAETAERAGRWSMCSSSSAQFARYSPRTRCTPVHAASWRPSSPTG